VFEELRLPAGLTGRAVQHNAREFRPRPHRHAELEVGLVVCGSATYLLRDRRYELTPGTVIWLFPGQDHVLVEESADHQLWWAVFTPDLVAHVAREPHLAPLRAHDPAEDHFRQISASSTRRLQTVFEQVHAAEPRDRTLANAGLAYLLALAWRSYLDATDMVDAEGVHPAIRTVSRLLRADPGSGLTALAAGVGLSPGHLSRLFSTHTGVSLTAYRNRQRLRRFLQLYGDGTGATMLSTALAAGFGSYAQFYRVFRQETGHNPATLRSTTDPFTPSSSR
jgi:AraC-like DNA-binding protein